MTLLAVSFAFAMAAQATSPAVTTPAVPLPSPSVAVSGHANARCRDSAMVPRFAGCTIRECMERDYDEAELQAGPVDDSGDFPRKLVEGQLSVVTYVCPTAATLENIARRSQASLRRAGFAVVYSGEMYHNQLPGFTARKGRLWVQVVSEPFEEGTGYTVTSVRAVAEEPTPRPRPARQRPRGKTTD
jgi:hypothetical protein